MKAIINSVKHIVQKTLTTVEEQTVNQTLIATVLDAQALIPSDVAVGAVIKAVWLEFWLLGESAQPCTATWTFEKSVDLASSITQAEMQNLHDYTNKRNILKMGQGVIGDSNSNPVPIIREWVKIPKGKQRFALGDRLKFTVSCIGQADNGLEICGFALYKEYQ